MAVALKEDYQRALDEQKKEVRELVMAGMEQIKERKTKDFNTVCDRLEVHKQVQKIGIGTKSQQALKLQREQLKSERKTVSREQREAEKQRQFELKQQKKKEKHRVR